MPGPILDAQRGAKLSELRRPAPIRRSRAQDLLHPLAVCGTSGFDPGNGSPTTHDQKALAPALHRVEEFRETPCGFGCAERPHRIRLSDSDRNACRSLAQQRACGLYNAKLGPCRILGRPRRRLTGNPASPRALYSRQRTANDRAATAREPSRRRRRVAPHSPAVNCPAHSRDACATALRHAEGRLRVRHGCVPNDRAPNDPRTRTAGVPNGRRAERQARRSRRPPSDVRAGAGRRRSGCPGTAREA